MTENTDSNESQKAGSAISGCSNPTEQRSSSGCECSGASPPCDACDTTQYDTLHDISLGERAYDVCGDCLQLLVADVEEYHWWDRLTEAHYNRAAEFLRSLDAIWCVKDQAYTGGELWVHTPYCDAAVVRDVCDYFGFQIRWFSVVYPVDDGFECVSEHGPCVEINLTFTTHWSDPLPLEYDIQNDMTYHEIEWLDESRRLFTSPFK